MGVGPAVGSKLGRTVGDLEGVAVGDMVGAPVGSMVGPAVGATVGLEDGIAVGLADGAVVGATVGDVLVNAAAQTADAICDTTVARPSKSPTENTKPESLVTPTSSAYSDPPEPPTCSATIVTPASRKFCASIWVAVLLLLLLLFLLRSCPSEGPSLNNDPSIAMSTATFPTPVELGRIPLVTLKTVVRSNARAEWVPAPEAGEC
jgi:hypothetical protein